MTLCIAAACSNHRQDAIVLCIDSLVTTGTASSETEYKLVDLGPYAAMFSGNIPEARELLSCYADYLARHPLQNPSLDERLEQLREPLLIQKREMIDATVRRRTGMSYQKFLDRDTHFDPGIRAKICADIENLSIDVDLIIVGGGVERLWIFRERMERIEAEINFACIGDGAEAAEQSLHRREQQESLSLNETLYHVYEAKRMGELAPTVGKKTDLSVFERSKSSDGPLPWSLYPVTPEILDYLEDCYKKYGPQPIPGDGISIPWPGPVAKPVAES